MAAAPDRRALEPPLRDPLAPRRLPLPRWPPLARLPLARWLVRELDSPVDRREDAELFPDGEPDEASAWAGFDADRDCEEPDELFAWAGFDALRDREEPDELPAWAGFDALRDREEPDELLA